MRISGGLILAAGIGVLGGVAFADGSDFVPRPTRNGAFVDLFTSYERDDNPGSPQSFGWHDTFFKEKLTLFSNGYFYHPRFLQYQASVTGALKQERFEASYLVPQDWRHGDSVEYDGRLFFLPEHPYNLELYALRYEPLFKTQAATEHDSLQSGWGALFQYRQRPWLSHARLTDSTTRSGSTSSNVRRLGLGGEYITRIGTAGQFSLNAALNPTHFSNSEGLDGRSTEYLFGNFINLPRVRLNSNVTRNTSDQDDAFGGGFEDDQFAWYELLSLYFPWNLRSDLSYRRQENDSTVPDELLSIDRTYSDTSDQVQLDIVHRLFRSLDTTYRFLDISRDSSGGTSTFRSNSLFVNYTKLVPDGRVLAGVNLGRSHSDTKGQADVVDESHPGIAVPGGIFTLDQQNPDPGSLALWLKSPLPPFQAILLVEGLHYVVTPVLNTLQITMLNLPPQFTVPGTYNFFADYSLSTGEFELETDNVGCNLSVELLNTMLIPYYGYAAIRSTVESGTFPGTPLDSTTQTAGLRFHRGPLRAIGEYQNLDWDTSPYRAWRGEVQYISSVNPRTRVYLSGAYLNKYYSHGTSTNLTEPYTDESATVFGSIQKQFAPSNLVLSGGGSFTHLRGAVDGNAYTVNGSLTWKIGRLSLSAGATAYKSDTQGVNAYSTNRSHEYYYVSLRREFF